MSGRILIALLLSLVVFGCGVKNDLELPSGLPPAEDERDPSRPPEPLGQ